MAIKKSLILVCSLIFFNPFSFADPTHPSVNNQSHNSNSNHTLENVFQVITSKRNALNKQETAEEINKLKNYYSIENAYKIQIFVRDQITNEIEKNPPSGFIIKKWIDVLSDLKAYGVNHEDDIAFLKNLKNNISNHKTYLSPVSNPGKIVLNFIDNMINQNLSPSNKSSMFSSAKSTQLMDPSSARNFNLLEEYRSLRAMIYSDPEMSALMLAMNQPLSIDILQRKTNKKWNPILNRDLEINEALDVLVRAKSRVPALIGDSGVGKNSVVEGLTDKILKGDLPNGIHAEELKNAFVILTTPTKISSINNFKNDLAAVNALIYSIKYFQMKTKRKIILVVDKANDLNLDQLDVFNSAIDSEVNPISMVWLSTPKAASFSFLNQETTKNLIEPVMIQEFDENTTFDVIKNSALPSIEKRYSLKISSDVLKATIEVSPSVRPDLKRPIGPLKVLEDLAISVNRKNNGIPSIISKEDLYQFAAKKARLPAVPQDQASFYKSMEKIKSDIKTEILGQEYEGNPVDKLVDLLGSAMLAKTRKIRSMLMIGTTGTGKTSTLLALKKHFPNSTLLEIDGTKLMKEDGGNYLFGPSHGYIGSDKSKGVITEAVDATRNGVLFVVVNEAEKMSKQQFLRFMEWNDTGYFTPSDGITRYSGPTVLVFNSNKGALKFFPSDFLRKSSPEQILKRLNSFSETEIKKVFLEPVAQFQNNREEPALGPEVLERIDAVTLQMPILKETAYSIAEMNAKKKLENWTADENFSRVFVSETYDPALGVRQINRELEAQITKIKNEHLKKYGPSQKLSIKTLTPLPGKSQVNFEVSNERNEVIRVTGPKLAYQNLLFDSEYKEKLKNLKLNLNKEIFGQTAYVNSISESIIAGAVDRGNPKPVSIYVSGMTGNGKTALPKALSKILTGPESEPLILEMGKVAHKFQLPAVFEKLENYLKTNKQGVIVFDEMGNAGGNDLNAKEEIAKAFYSMLDEGFYHSDTSQIQYNLKDFTIIFTGNEAEKLFAGHTQDDMLRSIWDENKEEGKIREFLKSKGLPPAFAGRIGTFVLMEPPTKEIKILVTRKLVDEWKQRIEKEQPVKINYDDAFISELSARVFNSQEGARAIGKFVNKTLGGLVGRGVFEVNFEKATHEKPALVQLSLETKAPTKPFYNVKLDETLAKVHVKVEQDQETIFNANADFTETAQFMKQIRKTDAILTAFHEAGHAILNDPMKTGRTLEHLTIVPADFYLGYARYKNIPNFITNYDRKALIARLAVLVAGSEAEILIGRKLNSGQASDLEEERKLLNFAAIKWGMVPELQGVVLDTDGVARLNADQEKLFDEFSNKMLIEAREVAKEFLMEHWHLEFLVAKELVKFNEISGKRVEELKKLHYSKTEKELENFFEKNGPSRVLKLLETREQRNCNLILKERSY